MGSYCGLGYRTWRERNWKSLALDREEWKKNFEDGQGPRSDLAPMIIDDDDLPAFSWKD
jgi:hypothetical protein